MKYWNRRKKMEYYKKIINIVNDMKVSSIIDIGNGGCPYVLEFNVDDITTLDFENAYSNDHIKNIVIDFMEWNPTRKYDLACCFQVLEHINNPKFFAQKLFKIANTVIISVPYKWPSIGLYFEPTHCQDPIDEDKIFSWMNKNPDFSLIAIEKVTNKKKCVSKRWIGVYL